MTALPLRVERMGPDRQRVLEEEVVALRRRLRISELAGTVAVEELHRERELRQSMERELRNRQEA